jgi:putative hydrolase of the HAD superfamily
VHAIEPFDVERTLFIDDSTRVLQAARDFGFRWLMAVVEPDSKGPRREVADFPAIAHFGDLLPSLHSE